MVVDQTGNDRFPAQVDSSGARTRQPADLLIGADSRNPIAADGECLRDRETLIDRDDLSVRKYEIGSRALCLQQQARARQRDRVRKRPQLSTSAGSSYPPMAAHVADAIIPGVVVRDAFGYTSGKVPTASVLCAALSSAEPPRREADLRLNRRFCGIFLTLQPAGPREWPPCGSSCFSS